MRSCAGATSSFATVVITLHERTSLRQVVHSPAKQKLPPPASAKRSGSRGCFGSSAATHS
jgi:hypothetical protein